MIPAAVIHEAVNYAFEGIGRLSSVLYCTLAPANQKVQANCIMKLASRAPSQGCQVAMPLGMFARWHVCTCAHLDINNMDIVYQDFSKTSWICSGFEYCILQFKELNLEIGISPDRN